MKLRVGIVGLGDRWDVQHRPALQALNDRFEVRAVCAEVALQAERAARQFDAASVDGFRVLADREDVDVVLVLSPEWYGVLPIFAACDAGKAVYCAAALDIEPEQALKVRQRVREAGIAFMAEFPRRQAPATLRLKELIATSLGPAKLLFCHQRLPVRNQGHCRGYRAGNPPGNRDLLELVDWCCYVVGEDPTSVVGVSHRTTAEAGDEDYRMMSLDFSTRGGRGTGPLAQISCGRYVPSDWDEVIAFRRPAELQICCENGVAFVDLPSTLVWFDQAGRHLESLDSERPVGEQLLLQFHRAVTSLICNPSNLEDACRALSIVLAATKSMTGGTRAELQW